MQRINFKTLSELYSFLISCISEISEIIITCYVDNFKKEKLRFLK